MLYVLFAMRQLPPFGAILWLTLFLLALISLHQGTANVAARRTEPEHPPVTWDPRLDALHVTYAPAADCHNGCWRLVLATFEDENQSGGNHNIYARIHDGNHAPVADMPWHIAWTEGNARILTKAAHEWADFPIYACYDHTQGPGGYRGYAGDNESQSDVIWGMGLPQCQHVNFRLIWQWQPAGDPTATATLSPTETITPTATIYETPGPMTMGAAFPMVYAHNIPTPTATLEPSFTVTPNGSETPIPTPDDTPAPTFSPTPEATATGTATTTATPDGNSYDGAIVQTFPNCGLTQVFGIVHDAADNPQPGTRIRLTWDGPGAQVLYATAGDYVRPETDASGWDFVLASSPVANTWRVAVVDASNTPISPDVFVQTEAGCEPNAVNVAKIRFGERP